MIGHRKKFKGTSAEAWKLLAFTGAELVIVVAGEGRVFVALPKQPSSFFKTC